MILGIMLSDTSTSNTSYHHDSMVTKMTNGNDLQFVDYLVVLLLLLVLASRSHSRLLFLLLSHIIGMLMLIHHKARVLNA